MSVALRLEELLDYSDYERQKWRDWFAADPERLQILFQQGGLFPTLGALLDHVFLVERRHLSRLEGGTPPDSTGIDPVDAAALFEYADLVRADLRHYVAELDDTRGIQTVTINVQAGTLTMSYRKLAAHIVLHEIRHLAQMAYAARLAGHEPPGQHDYFYYPGT